MRPFGPVILDAAFTPFDLYRAAAVVEGDGREELEGFALDLATIRDLPEYERSTDDES